MPTCGPQEAVSAVADAVRSSPYGVVVVLHGGVLAGTVDERALDAGGDRVEDVMRAGTTTIRPSQERGPLEERMQDKGVEHLLVTRSDGHLLGVYRSGAAAG